MEENKSINAEILEELEVFASLKKVCTIKFEAGNGAMTEIRARIINVYTLGEDKYLRTDDGLSIRLDKLLQVDDKRLKKNC